MIVRGIRYNPYTPIDGRRYAIAVDLKANIGGVENNFAQKYTLMYINNHIQELTMKKLFCIFVLLVSSTVNADVCFNASEISKKAAYVAAPDIEAAIVSSASDFGWNVDKQAAQTASYGIVGQLGAVQNDDLMVCITLNSNGNLALRSYLAKRGKEVARNTPLKGRKK